MSGTEAFRPWLDESNDFPPTVSTWSSSHAITRYPKGMS